MKWCHLPPIRSQFDISFPNIPLLLCNYPHLRDFEVHDYENMQNTLKINDYRKTLSFSKYLCDKSSNLYEILNLSSNDSDEQQGSSRHTRTLGLNARIWYEMRQILLKRQYFTKIKTIMFSRNFHISGFIFVEMNP